MADATVNVDTGPDGTVFIQPHGVLGASHAVELRRTVVATVRHTRPLRLVLDLRDVDDLDSINVGTLVAAFLLGDDHNVAVFLDYSSTVLADRLIAAGVPVHRTRQVAAPLH